MPKIERRFVKTETRATRAADGTPEITGYAAVFNSLSEDLGWFREIIMPGAFRESLAGGADVRCLFNHDSNFILGRTKSKTLDVTEDNTGLKFTCRASGSDQASHVVLAIERGDIDGCSFGFYIRKQEWVEETDEQGETQTTRRVVQADLVDVGPVTFPAYPGTSVSMRSLFPDGTPEDVKEHRPVEKRANGCKCQCPECLDGDCADCSNLDCEDLACEHDDERSLKPAATLTRRVDGEDLPAARFLIVGDPQDPASWKLPWQFAMEAKTKGHLERAKARLDKIKNVTDEARALARAKLTELCKVHGIPVAEPTGVADLVDVEAERRKLISRLAQINL